MYLLHEVDTALERMENGTYGICETCHDPIEQERLAVDPLLRNCIEHLSAAEQRALERDLDLAFQIQQGLLPKNDLRYDGWSAVYHYEPAGAVSGDYCDIIIPDSTDGSLFFFVGDVTGKGVAASILMGHLHAMFRSLLIANLPLGELVARANRIFCEGTTTSHFATLVSGRANAQGEVEVCNAGHPSPLLVRHNGVEPIASTAPPIGLFCSGEFPTSKFTMSTGDSLVLYTDGLTESRSTSQKEYGEERLSALLRAHAASSPRELLGAILHDVHAFRGKASKTDDLAILVLRREV
jgi:sigma-B regulation protein RsbU (phosphoserine phosphatase)